MKGLKFLAVGAVAGFMFASCGSNTQPLIEGVTKAEVDSVSYAVGTSFGQMIKGSNIEGLDYSKVMEAMKDVVNGKEYHVVMSHFPMAFWNHQHHFRRDGGEHKVWAIHLYGHVQNRRP